MGRILCGVAAMISVSSIPFDGSNCGKPYNASGVVPVGERRFVFIDNDDPHALFEFRLSRKGKQRGLIVRRPLVGLARGDLSDPEGLTRIDTADGAIDLVVTSSLGVVSDRGDEPVVADGLVRVRYSPHGDLQASAMPNFRRWLLGEFPSLVSAARRMPDDNGLNIEGLAWDPVRRRLLFGVRSPVHDGRIPVLGVGLDPAAPWTTHAFGTTGSMTIEKSDFAVPQGIRDLSYDDHAERFIVVVGRSVSGGKVPFELCRWDGASATAEILDVTFTSTSAKPEGVTAFWDDADRRMLIVDDSGGFAMFASPM